MSGPDCEKCGEHFTECECEKPALTSCECPTCFFLFTIPAQDKEQSTRALVPKECGFCEEAQKTKSLSLEKRVERILSIAGQTQVRRFPDIIKLVHADAKYKKPSNRETIKRALFLVGFSSLCYFFIKAVVAICMRIWM